MKHFLFLRHGPVAEEYQKIFYGQLDIPLSEEGKRKSLQEKAPFEEDLKKLLL